MKKTFMAFLICVGILFSMAACGAGAGDSAEIGEDILSSFTAVDLDGNAVDQSLLSDHKITMVNVWGTFCSPCIGEMSDLAALHQAYADQGFQVIGIPIDVVDKNLQTISGKITDAEEIIASTGADYCHLVPSKSLNDTILSGVQSVPLTVFVDEEGRQVGPAYLGAKSREKWETIIKELLESVQ